jgi:hypothetical protein
MKTLPQGFCEFSLCIISTEIWWNVRIFSVPMYPEYPKATIAFCSSVFDNLVCEGYGNADPKKEIYTSHQCYSKSLWDLNSPGAAIQSIGKLELPGGFEMMDENRIVPLWDGGCMTNFEGVVAKFHSELLN